MYIKSQEGKKVELDDDLFDDENPYEEEPTSGEAALRGAGQGLSMGFLDELKSMLGTSGASPSEIVAQPKLAAEKEREMFQQYETQLAEERAIDEAMKKAQPEAYMAGELTGGIVPGLATGGASAAGGVLKEGTKQALKQAAKIGAGYGAVSGAGYSEADNPLDLAKDVAVGTGSGAAIGAALPLAAKGVKEAYKGVKSIGGKAFDILPKSEQMKATFKYGKQGKSLEQDVIDKDLKSLGTKVLKNINKKKKANRLDEVIDQLDDMGYKVDTKQAVEEAVEDLQKLADGDLMGQQNKELLPRLQELLGKDKQTAKMVNTAEKKALKKAVEGQSKAEQAIIKGEKALAKEQIKSGDSLETITDMNRPMSDLDMPLDTQGGIIGGVKGRLKNADGTERIVSKLDDVTPYQPEMSVQKGPDGRPIVTTKDLGSGKIEALIGDIETKVQKDLANMKVSEVEMLRTQLNEATGLAAGQGSKNDPVVQRAMKLAQQLKDLTDEAVRLGGDETLIDRRATFSDIFSAEDMLGIRKMQNPRRDIDMGLKSDKIAAELGFNQGFLKRSKADKAQQLLGDDVVTPEIAEQFDLLKSINETVGRGEAGENISRAGVYQMAAGKVPNLTGRAAKVISDVGSKVSSPVTQTSKLMSEMGSERLNKIGADMVASGSEGTALLGNRLLEALGMKGQGKNAAMWSLSQNPAFRSLVNRQVEDFSQEMSQDLGMEQELDDSLFDETPYQEEEQMSEEEIGRSPDGLPILDMIAEGEGSYDSMNQGTVNGKIYGATHNATKKLGKPLTEHTISEIMEMQSKVKSDRDNSIFAAGKFQIIPETMKYLVKNLDLDGTEVFSEELQDKLGQSLIELKRPKVDAYLKGESDDIDAAAKGLSKEWASLPNPETGNSYYGKGNKAQHSIEDVYKSLKESREEIEQKAQEAEREVDRVNQQQSSGDMSPISQLDSLLEKINNMSISQDDKDTLEDEAIAMEGHSDGNRLKEMIRKLNGLS
jgi:muramidase (phage lysozyme)